MTTAEVCKIGLDKITIYGIYARCEDLSYLDTLDNVFIRMQKDNGIKYPYVIDGRNVVSIRINDNHKFLDMTISFCPDNKGIVHRGCHMTLTVSQMKGDNLIPATKTEYDELLYSLPDYLFKKYRIFSVFDLCKIESFEIPANFNTNDSYSLYQRSFALLMSFLGLRYSTKHYGKDIINKDGSIAHQDETFLKGNKSKEFTIYNKSLQMAKKGNNSTEIPDNIVRLEIRLLNKKQIINLLGTNDWCRITQYDVIWLFNELWNKNFLERYFRWKKDTYNFLKKLYNKYSGNKRWAGKILQEIHNKHDMDGLPFILGKEQIEEVIYQTKGADRHWQDKINTLERNKTAFDALWNGDYLRLVEIISKIDELICSSEAV